MNYVRHGQVCFSEFVGFFITLNRFGKKVSVLGRGLLVTLPDIYRGAFLRRTLAVYSKNSS